MSTVLNIRFHTGKTCARFVYEIMTKLLSPENADKAAGCEEHGASSPSLAPPTHIPPSLEAEFNMLIGFIHCLRSFYSVTLKSLQRGLFFYPLQ